MKQKLITIILTLIAVLAPTLIFPKSVNANVYSIKLWVLLGAGFLLLILLLASYKTLKIDAKDVLILIFLALVFISTMLSSNVKKSIIGETGRYEGLLMFATYVLIYFCAKKYFKYENIKIFMNIVFYTYLMLGILGIVRNYVKIPSLSPIFGRGITFGNSNFFGSFISIVLPIAICVFILKGNKKAFFLSLVMFYNLIASGTRSAWVAFAVISVMGFIYLIKQKNKKYWIRFGILLVCFSLIFIYLLNGFGFKTTTSTTQGKLNQIKNDIQTAQKTGLTNNMGSGRIEIWKMTLKLIGKKPIFGCGTDNLYDGLYTDCYEDLLAFAIRTKTVVDKAHNEYLQIAATIGIPALAVYLIFVAIILLPQIKNILKDKFSFIICITIISYLVQAFFNISTIGVAPIFWMILGLANNENIKEKINNFL